MPKITLRKASNADIEKIIPYINKYTLDGENLQPEQFIIAEVNDKLAGFGRIKPYENLRELASIGVVEKYRKLGVGSKIIRHIIENFPDNEIWITTHSPDYFKKFGFVESKDPPVEIKEKCCRVCASIPEDSTFMFLKKS
jgi:amino-acid N-acetyltransferase